jgi:hypothetical protein
MGSRHRVVSGIALAAIALALVVSAVGVRPPKSSALYSVLTANWILDHSTTSDYTDVLAVSMSYGNWQLGGTTCSSGWPSGGYCSRSIDYVRVSVDIYSDNNSSFGGIFAVVYSAAGCGVSSMAYQKSLTKATTYYYHYFPFETTCLIAEGYVASFTGSVCKSWPNDCGPNYATLGPWVTRSQVAWTADYPYSSYGN